MSAPGLAFKGMKYSLLGLMASNACGALQLVLNGDQLSQSEAKALRNAMTYLREIASGAEFVSSGRAVNGFNSKTSVEALRFALNPLRSVKDAVERQGSVSSYLFAMADAIETAAQFGAASGHSNKLEEAQQFFLKFMDGVRAEINSKQPIIGSPKGRVKAYARAA